MTAPNLRAGRMGDEPDEPPPYVWTLIDIGESDIAAFSTDRAPEWYDCVPWVEVVAVARRFVTLGSGYEPVHVDYSHWPQVVSEGLQSLLWLPIEASADQITDGRHRIAAMRRQGVDQTIGIAQRATVG